VPSYDENEQQQPSFPLAPPPYNSNTIEVIPAGTVHKQQHPPLAGSFIDVWYIFNLVGTFPIRAGAKSDSSPVNVDISNSPYAPARIQPYVEPE